MRKRLVDIIHENDPKKTERYLAEAFRCGAEVREIEKMGLYSKLVEHSKHFRASGLKHSVEVRSF